MIDLKQSVQFIKGVGPSRVKLLNILGVYTIEDLISYYPRTYEDRTKITKIAELQDGQSAMIEAVTTSGASTARLRRNMTITKVIVEDDTGRALISWFNQDYVKTRIHAKEKYRFFGRVSKKSGITEFNSPVFDAENEHKNTGKIVPVYPTTKGLNQTSIRQAIEKEHALENEKI